MDTGKSNAVGSCFDCDWEVEDTDDGVKLTREHTKDFKHKAFVEVSRIYSYDCRDDKEPS